jgi:hypothetical protein
LLIAPKSWLVHADTLMHSDAFWCASRTKILGWFFAVIWTIDPVVSSCVSYERCLDAEQGIPSGFCIPLWALTVTDSCTILRPSSRQVCPWDCGSSWGVAHFEAVDLTANTSLIQSVGQCDLHSCARVCKGFDMFKVPWSCPTDTLYHDISRIKTWCNKSGLDGTWEMRLSHTFRRYLTGPEPNWMAPQMSPKG